MRSMLAFALLLGTASMPIMAHDGPPSSASEKPVAAADLLSPPADADHYVVVSEAGKHGDQWRWRLPDGRYAYRWSQELRGWITEMDEVQKMAVDGSLETLVVRGVTMTGNAAESFTVSDGTAHWESTTDSGEAQADGYYVPAGGVIIARAPLIEMLARAGEAGAPLLPRGKARLTFADELEIEGPAGPQKVKLAFLSGLGPSPVPYWLTQDEKFFAAVGHISVLPKGYEGALTRLRDTQEAVIARRISDVAQRFLTEAARAPVLFDNVTMFDADAGTFLKDRAVLASDGRIAQIGAAGSITPPTGTRVIDASGKTLVPGIWDSHLHIGNDYDVLNNIANGITSFRSPGTTFDRAIDVVKRRASGELLMGEPFISVIVDQKHPLAAQGAQVVSSEADTIETVRRIDAAGLWGVKFYTSMNPEWIAPAAAEAHRLGLHVHGHVPATMRPSEAVAAGYDEITHINFIAMEAMPDEVVDKSNTRQRLEGPARYFKDVDLDGPAMSGFIADLARRQIIIDPTLIIVEGLMGLDPGQTNPAYAPYAGIVAPAFERRTFASSGYPLVEGLTRADYRASYEKMRELVGKLHRAGVPIVAGTDGYGIELVRELELYEQAGMTPAQALQSATIVPARIVGAENRTGSIAIGKEADLVLVDGDPQTEIGALRRVVTVVSDGYLMDGAQLREAAGYSGMPK